jgi:hypothetical protein
MSRLRLATRAARTAALAATLLASLLPGVAAAVDDYPTFYATIVGIAADRSSLTVAPTKDQLITIDVRDLGTPPFDQGAFMLDNVVLLRTKRLGGALVATGWEQARNGDEESASQGIEQRRSDRDRPKEEPPRPR